MCYIVTYHVFLDHFLAVCSMNKHLLVCGIAALYLQQVCCITDLLV